MREREGRGEEGAVSRAKEGGLTSGRLYPEYPPRCFAQWGLLSYSKCWRAEKRTEPMLSSPLERDKSLKAAANYDDTTGIRECQNA